MGLTVTGPLQDPIAGTDLKNQLYIHGQSNQETRQVLGEICFLISQEIYFKLMSINKSKYRIFYVGPLEMFIDCTPNQ